METNHSQLPTPNSQLKNGFSLIELIVYVAIVSVFLVVVTSFTLDVVSTRTKSQSMQEVQQNMRLALLRMSREIRAGEGINEGSCTFDAHPGQLSVVRSAESGKNPTVFDLKDGRLRMSQGGGDFEYLTGDRTEITNLVFVDLSTEDTVEVIRIELSAEFVNPGEREEREASIDLETSVSMRKKE